MSKIQAELQKVTGINPADDQSIVDQAYMKKIVKAASKDIPEKDWDKLSEEAKDWVNDAVDKLNEREDIPNYPDYKEPAKEEKISRRRSSDDEDDKGGKTSAAYAVGDEVEVLKTNGRTVKGIVKDLDDDGDLVLIDEDGELAVPLNKIESVTVTKAARPAKEEGRRSSKDEDDEQPAEVGPEVGDEVKITKTNDRTVSGTIVEIDEDDIVFKDEDGDEIELARSKVKSIEITKKAKKAAKPAEKEDAKDDGKKTRAGKGDDGVSVSTRVFQIMAEDPRDLPTVEAVVKQITKEGRDANANTIKINHTMFSKIIDLLIAGKHLK